MEKPKSKISNKRFRRQTYLPITGLVNAELANIK